MLLNISTQKQKIYPIIQSFRGNQPLPAQKIEQDSFVALTSEEIIENFKKIKDGYEERYYDDYTLDNIRLRKIETQRNLLRLAQLKDINNCLYFDSKDLSNISFRSDDFIKNIVFLTQIKDKNNRQLISAPIMSTMVINQADETLNKFCRLLQAKDESGEPLFRILTVASALSRLDDKKIQRAIELAKIKAGEKRTFSETILFELVNQEDTVINSATKLASQTDENGEKTFYDDNIIVALAKEDEKTQNSAIKLAQLKDINNNALLSNAMVYRLAKEDENIQNQIVILASNIKKDGSPLFDDHSLVKIIEEKQDILEKAIALTKFQDDNGDYLFNAEETIALASLDEKSQRKAEKLARIKDKKGNRLLRSKLLIGLLDKDENTIQEAIKLRQIKDKNNKDLFSEKIVLALSQKTPETQLNTQEFIDLINQHNECRLMDEDIEEFISKDEEEQKLIISLTAKKDINGLFMFPLVKITEFLYKNYNELLGIKLLCDIEDENGNKLFNYSQVYYLTETLKKNNKTADAHYLEGLRENLQILKIKYFNIKKERASLAHFLIENADIDLSDFASYIKSIDLSKVYEIAPQLKNYNASELLNFYNYHYRNGRKTTFEAKDLTLNEDLTKYLEENYLNGEKLTALYDALPLTARKVGKIPDDWLELVKEKDKQKAIDEIYSAIEIFRLEGSEEKLSQKLEEILKKKVTVSYIDEGAFGKCYKISIENAKDYCIKIFTSNTDISYRHGVHAEVQNALIANKYSDEYVKFYFGKVAPSRYTDGFLVTQFLSSGIKAEQTGENWNKKYTIFNNDSHIKNQINGTFVDFGGILITKK